MLKEHISFARATETLNNIKSSYTQNRLKYGSKNTERKVRNVRGRLTYKEKMSSEDYKILFPKRLSGQLAPRPISGQLSSINTAISRWLLRFKKRPRNLPAALGNCISTPSLALKQLNAFFQVCAKADSRQFVCISAFHVTWM